MNGTVGSSFKVIFGKKSTCGSREQCMGPIEKCSHTEKRSRRYRNSTYVKVAHNCLPLPTGGGGGGKKKNISFPFTVKILSYYMDET